MKRIIYILLILILLSTKIFASKTSEFEYLTNKIKSSHKDFYNSSSKAECEKLYDTLVKDIENCDDATYYFKLSSYLALSNDSHTSLYAPNLGLSFKYYGLLLNFIGDNVYVVSGIANLKDYMAKRVIKINDYPIETIIERGGKVVPHDNEEYLKLWLNNQLNNTSFLSFINIANNPDDDVRLTFDDKTTLTLSTMPITQLRSNELISASNSYSPYIYQGYYEARDIAEHTLLISYNTCAEDSNYSIKDFTKDIKKKLSKTKYKKIIVDLRYNMGGDSSLFGPIIELLKKKKCEKYCLIGEQTFSSGILNAVALKDKASFTLVGTPTGGSINHFGEIKSFTLPESGWEVYFSTKYFKLSKKYEGSIIPDVKIEKDISAYIEGRDLEIEYCLK